MNAPRFLSIALFSFLFVVFLSSPPSAAETLIAPGAAWKYDDTGTDLGTEWREVSYDDSAWASGPAQLGYGDGDEATVISYGSDSNNKYPCYYFRHGFSVADPTAYDSLTLRVVRDDGCVVYLNGTEVARSNMPAGEVTYGTWASAAVGGDDESAWHEFSVDPNLLAAEWNVVAVEVHQSSATSSDVSFDLELTGEFPPPPLPEVTLVSPADGSLVNSEEVTFTCSATDDVELESATLYIGNQPQTVTFSGPADTDDAEISADQPNTTLGSATQINVDGVSPHSHAVVKFLNVFGGGSGQVPAGSSIVQATLEVNCFNAGNAMQLYRLLEDWVEGEVTWNERAFNSPWTDAGADGPGSHAELALDGDCSGTGWRAFDITSFVQEWSNGEPNFGIVLTDTGTDGVDFYASESATPPVLTVTYQPDWQAVETQPLSGTSDTAIFTTTLTDQQDYVWNCFVRNISGGESWAPANFRLTVDTYAPYPPALVGPADDATDVATYPSLEVTVTDPNPSDVLEVTFYGRAAAGGEEFTIIALPDTQKYCLSYPEIFTVQTQWIVDNRDALNILFVTHEGDIVDTWDSTTEWQRADISMSLLDGVVPYGLSPGNHDQPTTYYNQYFPYTRYESEPWYGGHRGDTNDTNYELFSAGGEDYILLQLEYWPGDDVIGWASDVLSSNAGRKAIVTTHGFLGASGERSVHGMGSTQYIWDGLVVPNDNVYFVLCGHVDGEYARTDTVNGREVHQLLADYQGRTNGGDGWLRIMRFVPPENKVYVQTYSPWLDQYETDADSQFTLNFPMGGFSVIGTDTGVSSGSNASVVWPGLSLGTEYEWYATVTDSTGRMQAGPVWSFTTTFQDTTPPVISGVDAVDVTDNAATIVWATDEPADSLVDYGLDTSYGEQESDGALVVSHSIVLTGLVPETTYHYCVTSRDGAANAAWSGDDTFTTSAGNHPPVAYDQSLSTDEDAPVDIILTASDGDNDPLIYSIVTSPANGSLSGDPPNVTYTPSADYSGDDSFTFQANDGQADSNIATVSIAITSVDDPPAAPQNLSATAGAGTVSLDWDDNVEPEGDLGGYNVYRSTTSGSYDFETPLASVTESAYVDNDVTNGTTYYYVVKAVDTGSNESDPSEEVSATPTDTVHDAYVSQDPIVTYGTLGGDGIAGTTTAGDGLVQTVTEVANGKSGRASMEVEYVLHTTASPAAVTLLVLHLDASWTNLDANDPLIVSIWDGSGWEDITADVQDGSFQPASPEGYIDAEGNIRLLFKDTAPIRWEKKDTLAIDLLYAHVLEGPPDTEPPGPPTGLVATPAELEAQLSWNANSEPDLAGYRVYRSTTQGSGYEEVTSALITDTSYTDPVGAEGTCYYVVTAEDVAGNESGYSNEASVTLENEPPAAPTGLSATAGDSEVSLDWNDNAESDFAGYNVYRSTTGGGPYDQLNAALVLTSDYVDSTAENGATYYYVVRAVDSMGAESGNSNEASATPEAEPTIHVENIGMELQSTRRNWKAVATVLIVDRDGAPQEGATVVGDWYFKGGLIRTGASGMTDGTGNAVLTSPSERARSGEVFRFVVTDVALAGFVYDPGANVETEDSIAVP